jgi:hypothetical protein
MAQHPFFEISPDQIAALGDEDLRLLIAELCKADLRQRGLPTSAVLYGGNQTAADGGIDVEVELPSGTDIDGFIPRPATGFQSKTEKMPAGKISKEMCPEVKQADGPKARSLRVSIGALAAEGGAYVIVSSKDETSKSALEVRRIAMRAAVADLPGSEALHLDFYDRTRLATWVNDYPGVVLWVRERTGALVGWRPLGNWSGAPVGLGGAYLSDDTARLRNLTRPQDGALGVGEGIVRLRSLLSVPGGLVRLTGLSGTGKTRLLEALFDPAIGDQPLDLAQAIYADIGHESPEPSASQLAARLNAEGKRAILLLDNCSRDTHEDIAVVIKVPGSRLSLITVDLDIRDDKPEDTDVFRLQGASEGVMDSLLAQRYPALPQAIRRRIAEFSGGNARIALLAAGNLGPETNLADLSDEWLFERLFHQRKPTDAGLLQAGEALALVYSFDGETWEGDGAELPVLAQLAGLDVRVVQRAVAELIRREIVQTRGRWRAILPQPVATWLAKRALENQPAQGIADAFLGCGNPRLLQSFAHRLSYLYDSAGAQQIAGAWLGAGGPFSDLRDIAMPWSDPRMDLLSHLAPVAPSAALDLIERLIDGSTLDQLKPRACQVRDTAMSLLRKLAWFPAHFRRSALLLSRFVQAELAEPGRNHSTSNLEELFWPWLSGTQADAKQRLAVVEELLSAPDCPSQESGMIALRGMLKAGGFTSSHDFSFGGRAVDYGWAPQSLADYQDWYGGALEVATRLALSNSPLRAPARQALAENFRALWCFGHIFDRLEAAVLAVGTQEHWPQGWLEVRETIGLDAERMEAGLLARLRELKERLAPIGLRERLRVYVLTPAYQIAQLGYWEAPEADDGYEQAEQAVIDEALRLGHEVGEAPNLLDGIWPELFGRDAHQASRFGEGLAETVVNLPQTWRELLGHYGATEDEHRNPSLLVGFLRALALRDNALVEGLFDVALADPLLAPIFPLLQTVVTLDEAGVRRLTASVASGLTPARAYRYLGLGPATETIPPVDLARIILGIAGLPDGYKVAVDILATHLGLRKAPPTDWDPSLLDCGRELLRTYPADQINHSAGYQLAKIARVCLRGLGAAPDAGLVCLWIADGSSAHSRFLDDKNSARVSQIWTGASLA